MSRLVVLCCLLGVAFGGPPVSRSREDIEAFKQYLEQGRTDNGVRLETRMEANPKAKAWENSGKYQGDILLDNEQVEGMVNEFALGRNAYTWPNTKWPNNIVIWEFGANELTSQQQTAVWSAIADIEINTCIRFRYRTNEANFVRVTGNPDGCYAHVGFWQGRGIHIFNLARSNPGTGCFIHTTIVHEWLHIIGFLHMQSTHNRDDYVRIMWQNISPGMEYNFDKYDSSLVNNMGLEYDYASTMHYGPYGFSTNGQPTIVAIHSWGQPLMGQQSYVTGMDWLRVNRHYNCPGAWSGDLREAQNEIAEEDNAVESDDSLVTNEIPSVVNDVLI